VSATSNTERAAGRGYALLDGMRVIDLTASIARSASPRLGEHNEAVLRDLRGGC
jgi:hypothetical protein